MATNPWTYQPAPAVDPGVWTYNGGSEHANAGWYNSVSGYGGGAFSEVPSAAPTTPEDPLLTMQRTDPQLYAWLQARPGATKVGGILFNQYGDVYKDPASGKYFYTGPDARGEQSWPDAYVQKAVGDSAYAINLKQQQDLAVHGSQGNVWSDLGTGLLNSAAFVGAVAGGASLFDTMIASSVASSAGSTVAPMIESGSELVGNAIGAGQLTTPAALETAGLGGAGATGVMQGVGGALAGLETTPAMEFGGGNWAPGQTATAGITPAQQTALNNVTIDGVTASQGAAANGLDAVGSDWATQGIVNGTINPAVMNGGMLPVVQTGVNAGLTAANTAALPSGWSSFVSSLPVGVQSMLSGLDPKILAGIAGAIMGATQGKAADIQTNVTPWGPAQGAIQNSTQTAQDLLKTNSTFTPPPAPNVPTYDTAYTDQFLQGAIQGAIRPVQDTYSQTIMPAIGMNSVANNQFGSSRQAIAEAIASGKLMQTVGDKSNELMNQFAQSRAQNILGTNTLNSDNLWKGADYGYKAASDAWKAPWNAVTTASNIATNAGGLGKSVVQPMPETPWWQTAVAGAGSFADMMSKLYPQAKAA